jgi:hypothetical protein
MPFNGIANLRDAKESVKLSAKQLAEIKKCALDPLYFMNNYMYINTKDYGMQLFKTWPFQDAAVKRFLKYRFNINRWSRQVGKSTIVRGFILWYAMFHADQLVAMLANKLSLAKEQLQLLRDSYLALPFWLQPGVKLWNKLSIQFSNNTRILIAATTGEGIRGFSPNLLYLDEFAFLREGLADDFWASVLPSISSGKKTRVIITSTPYGMNLFYRLWQEAVDEETASYHDLLSKFVRSTVKWNEVPGRDAQWGIDEIGRIGEQKFRQEYECEFVGSAITLIDYKILQKLHPDNPLPMAATPPDFQMRMFQKPIIRQKMEVNGWTYIASIDTGYGIRKDYHVLQVLLAKSNIDLEQVFVMSSNTVTIEDFCAYSYLVLQGYGFPPLTIEYNGPGARTLGIMFNNLQYENLVHYDNKLRGMWATDTIKQSAVMLLKLYVQRFYCKLHDEATINELMSFTTTTESGRKWGATGGNHDDHVTSLYWCIYYAASPQFEGGNVEEVDFLKGLELAFTAIGNTGEETNRALEFVQDQIAQREQMAIGRLQQQQQDQEQEENL